MQAHLQRDLLGDWIVLIAQGGKCSRRGMVRTVAVANEAAGATFLDGLHKRRLQRGYALVEHSESTT